MVNHGKSTNYWGNLVFLGICCFYVWTVANIRIVSQQVPAKKGRRLMIHHADSPLNLQQTLKEQGIVGEIATLSCTFVPTDLRAAWLIIQGLPVLSGELLEGVTRIEGIEVWKPLPENLESLTFGRRFDQSLEGVTLPKGLSIAWDLAPLSIRVSQEWPCQPVFVSWNLDTSSTKVWKE